MRKYKVGVIGCGVISEVYLRNMTARFPALTVVGCAATTRERAQARAAQFNIRAMSTDELLACPEVEIVVNLTPPKAHYALIERALRAGKHVYTEKIIAPSYPEACALSALAADRGLYLCSAPDTFLGDALQGARKALDAGRIGAVTSCHANLNRQMQHYYEFLEFTTQPGGGIGYDVGVYYLTALLSLLGPVQTVSGQIATSRPTRVNQKPDSPQYGQTYTVQNENVMVASARFASGALGTFHFNGDAIMPELPTIALYGTEGVLYLSNPDHFGGRVTLVRAGANAQDPTELTETLPTAGAFSDNCRGIGVAEMANAMAKGETPRTDRAMALHAVELLDGVVASSQSGQTVSLGSTFARPAAMWERDVLLGK